VKHFENEQGFPGLRVNSGTDQPGSVNPDSVMKFLEKKRKLLSADEFFTGIRGGNVTVLSKAITLIESVRPDHQELAQEIIMKCLPFSGNSIRIGITGVPGVGKSTFIEALGGQITSQESKLAVLTVDPSSAKSKGSILGDKTRMEELSTNPRAYIRPSPSAGSLGGVARKTRETVILCEAAGYEIVFIETVGVGQSETAVHSMTDFFLLLMLPGAGDELQGIKRGIMEMADMVVVNKADGINIERAELAKIQYKNALHLFPDKISGWEIPVLTCSAASKTGITEVWGKILQYCQLTRQNGYFESVRKEQSLYWMDETIEEQLRNNFYNDQEIRKVVLDFRNRIVNSQISSFAAAKELLEIYFSKRNRLSH
jgi:LAO/AO transport system kinase